MAWKGTQSDCLDGVLDMNGDRDCQAKFELLVHPVTVAATGGGSGFISSTPGGINCGTNCDEDWLHGTAVVLTATAGQGSEFTGWSGHPDCADGALSVTEPIDCQATFELLPPEEYTLTMSKTGSGGGTVVTTPGGIDCGVDCTEVYTEGESVTFTPIPDFGSVFVLWKGTQGDCADGHVTMNGDRDCQAKFDLAQHTVTIDKAGSGSGVVVSQPTGISCGGACSSDFDHGALVVLNPIPDPGSSFTGWSGDPDCDDGTLTVTADVVCTALFD